MEPESSLPYSQVPVTCPYPESIRLGPRLSVWMFCNKISFQAEELLAPRPNTPSWRTTPSRLSAIIYWIHFLTKESDASRIQVTSFTVSISWPVTFEGKKFFKHNFVIVSLWFCTLISTYVLVIHLAFTMTVTIITNIRQQTPRLGK